MHDNRKKFLEDEFFRQTAAVLIQHGNVLLPHASVTAQQQFQTDLRQALQRYDAQYVEHVAEGIHIQNLAALAERMSNAHASALIDGRMSIGMAQKIFNFYLKYQWCLGWIAMPPHCPFDAVTFLAIPALRDIRWTQLTSLAEYLAGVAAAKMAAKGVPLALWELELSGRVVREAGR